MRWVCHLIDHFFEKLILVALLYKIRFLSGVNQMLDRQEIHMEYEALLALKDI